MQALIMSPEGWIDELNRCLKQDPMYEDGMGFFLVPEGARGTQASGYYHTGPDEKTGVYARIVHHVEQYMIVNPGLTHSG